MKYRRSLAGRPFTKDHPFTVGFEEGVGYMKNMLRASPALFITGVLFVVSTGILLGRTYLDSRIDDEEKFKYKPRYTVKRSDDVSDPSKPVFN